jgi:hypothetical protein
MVAGPASFHSPAPPMGEPSKYQISVFSPGSSPVTFGTLTGMGTVGMPPMGVPK